MQRVLVIGCGGAGKSTLSRQLSETMGLPLIHLDALYWKAGWIESDKEEWAARVRELVCRPAWIMDGNYSATLATRLAACDAVIFLDVGRLTCIWRVLKRVLRYRGRTRPDMPDGCPERFDFTFLLWVWNYPNRSRCKVMALLEAHRAEKQVIHLRSDREVRQFLASSRAAA